MNDSRRDVVLFDIDGTLLRADGAGSRAFARAYEARHGRPDACAHLSFAGMTDRAIAREGLRTIGAPDDEREIGALIESYLSFLDEELRQTERFTVLDSARRLAEALSGRARTAVGLGTGNVERGARLKLSRGGMDALFPFGGFGCDAEGRADLLRCGAERGAHRLGVHVSEVRVTVVWDTPKDVDAARAIGARCIAVATGGFDRAALRATGADLVVADLSDEAAWRAFDRDA